jgi:ribosomal-protein-alanine N-acetyltransferase
MKIEAFSTSDIDAVLKIESQSFRQPWGRISFLSELSCKEAIRLVAREYGDGLNNSVIAYMCGRFIVEEFYILKLAVSKKWRTCGIASQLLKEGLRRVAKKNTFSAVLDVRLSNQPAIGLYRKHGFQTVGIRPGYYSDTGEDALVMRHNLKEDL